MTSHLSIDVNLYIYVNIECLLRIDLRADEQILNLGMTNLIFIYFSTDVSSMKNELMILDLQRMGNEKVIRILFMRYERKQNVSEV